MREGQVMQIMQQEEKKRQEKGTNNAWSQPEYIGNDLIKTIKQWK